MGSYSEPSSTRRAFNPNVHTTAHLNWYTKLSFAQAFPFLKAVLLYLLHHRATRHVFTVNAACRHRHHADKQKNRCNHERYDFESFHCLFLLSFQNFLDFVRIGQMLKDCQSSHYAFAHGENRTPIKPSKATSSTTVAPVRLVSLSENKYSSLKRICQ